MHSDNVQRYNHGQGWIVVHQWTKLLLLVNGQCIPLPSIAFLSKEKCKELGQEYKTEPKRIIESLKNRDWKSLLPAVQSKEILVHCKNPVQSFNRLNGFLVLLKTD